MSDSNIKLVIKDTSTGPARLGVNDQVEDLVQEMKDYVGLMPEGTRFYTGDIVQKFKTREFPQTSWAAARVYLLGDKIIEELDYNRYLKCTSSDVIETTFDHLLDVLTGKVDDEKKILDLLDDEENLSAVESAITEKYKDVLAVIRMITAFRQGKIFKNHARGYLNQQIGAV